MNLAGDRPNTSKKEKGIVGKEDMLELCPRLQSLGPIQHYMRTLFNLSESELSLHLSS